MYSYSCNIRFKSSAPAKYRKISFRNECMEIVYFPINIISTFRLTIVLFLRERIWRRWRICCIQMTQTSNYKRRWSCENLFRWVTSRYPVRSQIYFCHHDTLPCIFAHTLSLWGVSPTRSIYSVFHHDITTQVHYIKSGKLLSLKSFMKLTWPNKFKVVFFPFYMVRQNG